MRGAHEPAFIEHVEAEFLEENRLQPGNRRRQFGSVALSVQEVPGQKAQSQQPNCRCGESVQYCAPHAAPVLRHPRQRVVRGVDDQGIPQQSAVEECFDSEARCQRQCCQQDERDGYGPVRLLRLSRLRRARVALEHVAPQAQRVERRHRHPGERQEMRRRRQQQVGVPERLDDGLLGEKAGEARHSDQRQRADGECGRGHRHAPPEAAHLPDVLPVMHRQDHRPRRQEQQRLEERVREQMENAGRIGRSAERHGHVAELGQGRIGDDLLDVVGHQADQPHREGGDAADQQDQVERDLAALEQRGQARHHEDARRHHGGGMDHRRDRGRTFHRIGQPDMQRHLCRLAHGTNEQEQADQAQHTQAGERRQLLCQRLALGEHGGIVQATGSGQQRPHAEQKPEIAQTVDQEGLEPRARCARAGVPEPDQQVRHQADPLPTDEQQQEIVRHHQQQHGEGEQRQVGEEPDIAGIPAHVADAVDVHQQRDEGDHDHHHHAQGIDQEADLHPVAARAPVVQGHGLRRRALRVGPCQGHAGQERDADARDRDRCGGFLAQDAHAQARQDRAGADRAHGDLGENRNVHHPRTSLRSSASMVSRLRNTTTTMARPIAISAAAIVRTNSANACPARS